VASHRQNGLHVDGIDVGPLFAVDLDVHESLVHEARGLRVFERFVSHDVAPVTRRVADAQQYRLVFLLCFLERCRSPWKPVHRIVGVLQEIRTCFVREAICHLWLSVPCAGSLNSAEVVPERGVQ
jgi:hypothetical protein